MAVFKNLDIVEVHGKQYLWVSNTFYPLNTDVCIRRSDIPPGAVVIGHLRNRGVYLKDFFEVLDEEQADKLDAKVIQKPDQTSISIKELQDALIELEKWNGIKSTSKWY